MSNISICIDVSIKKDAIDFYTQALNLELINEGDQYAELSADGVKVYLSENAPDTNPLYVGDAVRNYDRHWTPIHLDFTVKDIEACVSKVIELGGVKEGGKSGDWGSIAYCADPFGNGFCVMQLNE